MDSDNLQNASAEGIQPNEGIGLSVFMPFYNEEANIEKAVSSVRSCLESIPEISQYEIIIIDDGSSDATKEIGKKLVLADAHVRLISHEVNIGYGGAIATGLKSARLEYVFFTDGDLQFDMEDLRKFIALLPEHEAIIGYREKRRDPLARRVNALVWNVINRYSFGLRVKDINCAFKLFRRDLVHDLPLISKGAMISSEILVRLKRKGIVFTQIAVTHLPRLHGKQTGANIKVIVLALKECIAVHKAIAQTDPH